MLKKIKNWDFRTKASAAIVLGFLLLFFISRLSLYITYYDFFAPIHADRVIKAFIQGMRFDFAMIAVFVLPLIFLLNIPFNSKKWAKLVLWLICFVFTVFICLLIADFVYFAYVKRHMAEELLAISNDMGYIVRYAFTQLPLALIALAAVLGGLMWLANRAVNKYFYIKNKWDIIRFFVLGLLIFFGIRGKVFEGGKPIGIADVHSYSKSMPAANLTINGIFTSFHTLRKKTITLQNNTPFDQAVKTALNLLETEKTFSPDPDYPLMRQIKPQYKFKNYNIFVVLLESWNPAYIDSFKSDKNTTFGVTPNFDKIVQESAVFTNAYAAGKRSIVGFGSAFAGVPFLPAIPVFGYGLELFNLTSMGQDFQEMGYYTMFAQASNRESFRLGALARGLVGMQEAFGREDIPMLLKYKEDAPYGYDYETFMFAADKLKDKKNFFAITFTATTHEPFIETLEQFKKYPSSSWQDKYLNSLYYADYSIGELIKKAKEDGWFDNTIFIFLADHTTKGYNTIRESYHIPLVVYAPKIIAPKKYDYTVSQTDLLPTIYSLVNMPMPYTALGRDIFDASAANRFAFAGEGLSISLITDKGAITHNGKMIVESAPSAADFDKENAARQLLCLDKAATVLLKNNHWMKLTDISTAAE